MNWKYSFTPGEGIVLESELVTVSSPLPVDMEESDENALEFARKQVLGTIELEDGTKIESLIGTEEPAA